MVDTKLYVDSDTQSFMFFRICTSKYPIDVIFWRCVIHQSILSGRRKAL